MAFRAAASAPLFVQRLAICFVCLLMGLLGFGSQYFFSYSSNLPPGPLTTRQAYWFNMLIFGAYFTYYRACSVDPGRFVFPPRSKTGGGNDDHDREDSHASPTGGPARPRQRTRPDPRRYCRKCARPKPPRAHHCRHCGRCIPRMDHHCPWTANCVSLQTLPHFLRFLAWANAALWTLLWHLAARVAALWRDRALPAYLGPSTGRLAALTLLSLAAAVTALPLGIVLVTTLRGSLLNITLIEGWELDRHEAVVQRGDRGEGWWDDCGGEEEDDEDEGEEGEGREAKAGDRRRGRRWRRSPLEPVEFPYDIGFFANMVQAMGTTAVPLWLWPFAGAPRLTPGGAGLGWEYEENGLNDRDGMWPPPDPDKARHTRAWCRRRAQRLAADLAAYDDVVGTRDEQREAFRRRQESDLRRRRATGSTRSDILGELEESASDGRYGCVDQPHTDGRPEEGAELTRSPRGTVLGVRASAWVNADGERLGDYGVDEDAEDDMGDTIADEQEDEDVPLAQLIRQRKVPTKDGRMH